MPEAIRRFLDLDYTPTWPEILQDFAGAASLFLLPFALVFCAVALGWGHP